MRLSSVALSLTAAVGVRARSRARSMPSDGAMDGFTVDIPRCGRGGRLAPALAVTGRWVESLARLGFAVKGILYLMLGGSALAFALRMGGHVTDLRGEVAWLLRAPGGRWLVGAFACGLALYAAWRFLEAFADANRKGRGSRALASRAVYAISGVVYGVLAYDAARLASARTGARGELAIPPTLTGSALAEPVAILVALAIGAYGVLQIRKAFSAKLSDQLHLARVQRHAGDWPVRISRAGIGGRGAVLVGIAAALLRRATESAAAAASVGTADSMRLAGALPNGRWLLGGMAAGLMAYGVFQLVQARYRTIRAP